MVHGFGFSNALGQSLQFVGSHLLLSLFSFNVGIEIGQIGVLAVMWPALALFRRVVAGRAGGSKRSKPRRGRKHDELLRSRAAPRPYRRRRPAARDQSRYFQVFAPSSRRTRIDSSTSSGKPRALTAP
jgi:HupE / UreJ protein